MSLALQLIKGNFKTAIKSLLSTSSAFPIPIDPEKFTTPDGQEGWMLEMMGNDYHYFKYDGFKSCVKAYDRCPTVAAIINRKSQSLINGKTWVLNSQGKVATSAVAKSVSALLAKPNAIQSGKQFEAQLYAYMQMFGFAIILPIYPTGFTAHADATSLWNIPASWIDINATQERFAANGGVVLAELVIIFNGVRTTFKVKDLIIIRDITPALNSITFPQSKLSSLELPINNIIGAYESRNVLINYRGALGILSNDQGSGQFTSLPLTPDQKKELQRDFRQYGLRNRQMQVIMTTASLKWQQMGFATKDLQLMEEVQESSLAICAGTNFPPFMLGLKDATFTNLGMAEKGLYQNSTIPDADNIYEQFTNWFFPDSDGLLVLNKDFSHVAVLQEDQLQAAQARNSRNQALKIEWRNGMLTLNEWRVKNNEDPLVDDRGKLFFPEYVAIYGDPDKPITNGTQTAESGQGTAQPAVQNQS